MRSDRRWSASAALADFAAAEGLAIGRPVAASDTGSTETTKTMGPAQTE